MPRGSVGDRRGTFPILSLSGSVEYCRFAMAELCCCCRRETETVVTVEDTVVVLIG